MKILKSSEKNFWNSLKKIVEMNGKEDAEISRKVLAIINDVKKNGDKALDKYTRKFDNPKHKAGDFVISRKEVENAYKECSGESLSALSLAARRVEDYHKEQLPKDTTYIDGAGVKLGWRWNAIESAGVYVPGGTASYPSSVIMNVIPARMAGVKRVAMVVPAPLGKINPLVLAAAKIAGVDEIYKIGGAQAIAALAFGTKKIKKVDKIAGPGNAYVAAAKKLVYGRVGVDMVAGPSEIVVISDGKTNPDWVAADLLSQAEHDVMARSILITDDTRFAGKVEKSIERLLNKLSRKKIAAASLKKHGAIIITKNIDEACEVANEIAPEHLELCTDNPEIFLNKIKNAGAVFMGRFTPEAIGDYMAGPSHVLPTSGSARFSSGLSVFDFLKRSSLISCDEKSFEKLAGATNLLANEEGLTAHALSITLRRK